LYFAHFNPYRAARIVAQHQRVRSLPAGHEGVISLDATTGVHLRAGTTDLAIFDQIFAMQDCAVPFGLPASLIIDGGAHIGCAAIYYARRYRGARIIAVEAERGNYGMLKQNVAGFPNIVPIHGAIWSHGGKLAIADPGAQTWAFQVTESAKGEIPAYTIDDILAMSGHAEIGLLKLDIEGAEASVFAADCRAWLSRTHVINIELHDRLVPGCTGAFLAAIAPYGFSRRRRTQHNLVVARQ
jgi:FkbM family methyltransferase